MFPAIDMRSQPLDYNDDHGVVYGPISEMIAAYEGSVRKYPNIRPGEEFTRYPRSITGGGFERE